MVNTIITIYPELIFIKDVNSFPINLWMFGFLLSSSKQQNQACHSLWEKLNFPLVFIVNEI